MADVLERALRRPPPRDPRATLEPLLDEVMRSMGFERAAVLLNDEDRAALAGSFGIGVSDAVARELVIPLALADDPIVAALRGGLPQRIRDATTDDRISPAIRNTLAQARLGPIVAAPLRSTTDARKAGPDRKGTATPGWEHRGEWAGVVLLSRAAGVTQTDVDALVRTGAHALTWATAVFCLVRGLPVLVEGWKHFAGALRQSRGAKRAMQEAA